MTGTDHRGGYPCAILTGARASGKTGLILDLVAGLASEPRGRGYPAGGIVTLSGRMADGRPSSLEAFDLATGERRLLATRGPILPGVEPPRLAFSAETFAWGISAFRTALAARPRLLVLDEIGPLEFAGEGWAPLFADLAAAIEGRESAVLVTVRDGLAPALLGLLPANRATIIELGPGADRAFLATSLSKTLALRDT